MEVVTGGRGGNAWGIRVWGGGEPWEEEGGNSRSRGVEGKADFVDCGEGDGVCFGSGF